jgi:hypothetical protein
LAFTLPKPLNAVALGDSEAILDQLQSKIDSISFELLGLNEDDKSEIEGAAVFASAEVVETDEENDEGIIDPADIEAGQFPFESWAVGVAFGRFDIGLATGERPIPPEPEPFDALPDRSPGMLPGGTASFMPCSGILVDDPGHADDLVARVVAVYESIGQPSPDLEPLHRRLSREFFPAHLKMYTKSRRKAPVYWQLATPTANYSVWLYLHALNKDSLFRVQTDYVSSKLAHEQRRLDGLRVDAGPNPSASQRKAIEGQDAFVGELQALLDEVKRVAPLWNPNLDDGVVLLMAPLWRLVPQFKPWQKELKSKWDDLAVGKYDWSHVAMHLWPERVVPKCAADRSLAIAHGLEDVFWAEGHDGQSTPRPTPKRPIDEIVRERTSVAVKAALKELVDASTQTNPKGRARRSSP